MKEKGCRKKGKWQEMSRRRKRKQKEEHVDESWLLPYADLLTLLLALFIVLFAMSEVDSKRFEEISQSFNQALTGGSGIMDNPSPLPEPKAVSSEELEKEETTEELIEDPESEGLEKKEDEKEKKVNIEADKTELQAIQKKINAYIKDKKLSANLKTSLTDEGLLLSIRDNVLFSSGSDQVRSQDEKIAKEISNLLVLNPPRNIIISGHTDNTPIKTADYDSNWELSVMRSVNFMKLLLKNEELDPSWFSAKGFGEFKPVADNQTAEGRSKNRRVEILILPRSGE